MASKQMTEQIAEILRDANWCGVVCDHVVGYWTEQDARDSADQWIEDCWAAEDFQEDWFPFVAVPALRATLDWARIADVVNEEIYEMNVCYLFGE